MTPNLFNSNNLEGILSEISDNFNDFYVKPVKKAAKATKEFVFNPKAYGWGALYGFGFGAYNFILNHDKEFLVKAGSSAFRFASSVFLGRQALRAGQLIAKKIKNPFIAYPVATIVPCSVYATVVYGTMSLMGAENLTPLIIADAILTPPLMFPPLYFERNNIEIHPVRNTINYFNKKLGKGCVHEKF